MRINRIYYPGTLACQQTVELVGASYHYLLNVLRISVGNALILFTGDGYDNLGEILSIEKKRIFVYIKDRYFIANESSLNIHLIQALSPQEKMDFVIQKISELGANTITPMLSERSKIKLDSLKKEKRRQHWLQVAYSACEQSGRAKIPKINAISSFQEICERINRKHHEFCSAEAVHFILDPKAQVSLSNFTKTHPQSTQVFVWIGPEGGFSENEIDLANKCGVISVHLGPRILRTETAAIAISAMLQVLWGDA